MNRLDFQKVAETRLQEAKALLDSGFPDGAYYLGGYAVECAFKACIAKRTREHDFPDKTHNLKELLRLALLKREMETALTADPAMDLNWTIVQGWSEASRYARKTVEEAAGLLQAIEDHAGGLLPWVRQRW